jgi:hypothetical protein
VENARILDLITSAGRAELARTDGEAYQPIFFDESEASVTGKSGTMRA